ncbi:MAG: hypothetical protein ACE5JS_17075, partial [Nitrospinota bacterium]
MKGRRMQKTRRSRPRVRWGPAKPGWAGRALALFLSAWMAAGCAVRPAPRFPDLVRGGVVDGVGYAKIEDGDFPRARKQALDAALRDMALSACAVVRSRSAYRLPAEEGKPRSESLDDPVGMRALRFLATRRMREDVDAKAGVYRVYLWLTEEELRESIEQTRLARREIFLRARRLYEAAEAEKDPLRVRKKLRKVRALIEEAGLQAEPEALALHARVESSLHRVNVRIQEGQGLYDLSERALDEGRLGTATRRLQSAQQKLLHPERWHKLAEKIEKKRGRVLELKGEASNLWAEDRLEEALEAYQEAGKIDREDREIRGAVSDLRANIAWQRRHRRGKFAAAVANFFLTL